MTTYHTVIERERHFEAPARTLIEARDAGGDLGEDSEVSELSSPHS